MEVADFKETKCSCRFGECYRLLIKANLEDPEREPRTGELRFPVTSANQESLDHLIAALCATHVLGGT